MALTVSHAVGEPELPVRDVTIGALLREAATAVPDRLAMIEGITDENARRQWTYAELLAEAERCARALARRFRKGERVACWAHNIPEWVILEYGCALAGLVLVTVNPAYRSDEVKYLLSQSRAAGLFVIPEYRGTRCGRWPTTSVLHVRICGTSFVLTNGRHSLQAGMGSTVNCRMCRLTIRS